VKRLLAAVVALAGSLVLAAPASAFTPPEIYVRLQPWDDPQPVSGWIPLASAPRLNYLAGYQIGYKLQTPQERAAFAITGVPDGVPTQPYNDETGCVNQVGTPGDIVPLGFQLQFEGDGLYTVRVSVGADSSCTTTGASNTASFTVPTMVVPQLVGEPFTFRATPLDGNPFVGLRAADPPGGFAELRCTRGSLVAPVRGLEDRPLAEDEFPRPGRWSCAARGAVDGVDANFDRTTYGTPYSAPLAVDVRSDFRRARGRVDKVLSRRPRLTFRAEWPGLAKGGHARLTLWRVKGCRHHRYVKRTFGTFHGTFGAKSLRMRVRKPTRTGFYLGRFAFSGTPYIRASVDPAPVYMEVSFHRLMFATRFPGCA
jgi:hypothetical protein